MDPKIPKKWPSREEIDAHSKAVLRRPELLKKVRDLLARATSEGSTEEEARTSAMQAARLIQKHGFEVTLTKEQASELLAWQAIASWGERIKAKKAELSRAKK